MDNPKLTSCLECGSTGKVPLQSPYPVAPSRNRPPDPRRRRASEGSIPSAPG